MPAMPSVGDAAGSATRERRDRHAGSRARRGRGSGSRRRRSGCRRGRTRSLPARASRPATRGRRSLGRRPSASPVKMWGRNGASRPRRRPPMPRPTTIDNRTTRRPITAAAGRSSRPSSSATIVWAGIASASSDRARNMNMLITIWWAASVGSSMRPAIAVAPPNTASIEPTRSSRCLPAVISGPIPVTGGPPLRRRPQARRTGSRRTRAPRPIWTITVDHAEPATPRSSP